MAFLKKEQYEYRREAAAERNMRNELKAVDNGMTAKQAELISELCSLRHKLHCSMDSIVKDNDGDIYKRFVSLEERMEESGLPELGGRERSKKWTIWTVLYSIMERMCHKTMIARSFKSGTKRSIAVYTTNCPT